MRLIPIDCYNHIIHWAECRWIGTVVSNFSRFDLDHNGWKIMIEFS